ncbi:MAG: hypothetical protein JW888_05085, partial [Pirellulales bacterium]|nr:hypothetical protein [Pirellulales bacterium]
SNGYRLDMITGFGNQSDFLTLRELVSFALVSDIQNDDSGVQIFSERAGMSILYDIFGYSYLPLALNNAPFGTANTSHDILLNPDGAIQTSDEIVPNWHFEDDANFKVHPIPEPGIATLAISLLVATGLSRPRRRR